MYDNLQKPVYMNPQILFQKIRTLGGPLSDQQVESVNAILASCAKHGVTNLRQIAYIIATAYHESKLKPIEEIGKGRGLPYGGKLDMGGGPGKRVAYVIPDQLFYGRGLVQITWLVNYKAFGHLLNIDLVNDPALALQTPYAAEIAVLGMQKGMFTGVTLHHCFNDTVNDAVEAREIINGHNCATLIAGYYGIIYSGLVA